MNKLYAIGAALLLGLSMMAGSFHYGRKYERQVWEGKQVVDYRASVNRALNIADKFATIASDLVAKLDNTREVTKTITQTQVKYVTQYIHDHPEIATAVVVPAPVVQLRKCQISRLRRAAGYSVSGDSNESVCSTFVPDYGQRAVDDRKR